MFPLRFDPATIDRPHLLTIRYSHYCELARWAMDHAGVDYTEVCYAVGCHMEPIGSLRADPATWSTSSYPGAETGQGEERRQHSVPLVCLPGGQLLRDSWEVLAHFVAPVAPDWRERFDRELGPPARRFGYRALLEPSRPDLGAAMAQGITDQEQAFWDQAGPMVTARVCDLLGLTDEREAEDREHLEGWFEQRSAELDALPDPGDGPEATAWWIACSSLAALALLPPGYANGVWACPPLEAFDDERQAWVHARRDTPLGKAVMAFYAEARTR